MPAPEVKIACGARLVKMLADTGTGNSKLDPCRKKLADIHRIEKRIATSGEILAVLVDAEAPEGTLLKARTIIETGEWNGPPNETEVPVEVLLLGDEAVAEYKAAGEAKQAAEMERFKAKPGQPGVHPSPEEGGKFVGPVKARSKVAA